jgi:hypothetical protein
MRNLLAAVLENVSSGQQMMIGIARGNTRAWAKITAR